jgi:YfiH family protein
MAFVEADGLRYYQFDLFASQPVTHGLFTRRGGISPSPWESLNLGGQVGDERANVVENRRRMFAVLGREVESLYDSWQVHGSDVICVDAPRPLSQPHQKADIILTDQPAVTLLARFADCVPVLLFDPVKRVVGFAHAGWVGTVNRVAQTAVEAMAARYGSRPQDMLAGIGPSICQRHYPVGIDVVVKAEQAFGAETPGLFDLKDGKAHFDLWSANRLILEQAGVRQIEVAGVCTACHPEDWFSHRGEHGKTGRFGAIISLNA